MNHDQPQIPQNKSDVSQELKETSPIDWKRSETEYLGNFSGNSCHYNFEAGFGSKIEDLTQEISVGKQIVKSMAYDRGEDVNALIKMAPGTIWMEVSLTDFPSMIVSNITANKKGDEWFVNHFSFKEEMTLRKYIESFPLYHLLS